MHVWQWLLTGLVAGVVARVVLTGNHTSLGAQLAFGSLGALLAGALFRLAGMTTPEAGAIQIAIALGGALIFIAAMYAVLRSNARVRGRTAHAGSQGDLGPGLAKLDEGERRVLRKFLAREPVAKDADVEDREHTTLGQRAADRIAAFGGSWAFMGLFAAVLIAWMLYNSETAKPFDAFPFILLNLVLSCIAAAQAPVILMSQNRQAEKDRLHARLDYEVNLKAEVEILALHEKLDELRDRAWRELLEMQQRQLMLLEKLEKGSQA